MVESSALLKRRTSKGYRGFESLPHRFLGITARNSANLTTKPTTNHFRFVNVFGNHNEKWPLSNGFRPGTEIEAAGNEGSIPFTRSKTLFYEDVEAQSRNGNTLNGNRNGNNLFSNPVVVRRLTDCQGGNFSTAGALDSKFRNHRFPKPQLGARSSYEDRTRVTPFVILRESCRSLRQSAH